MANKMTKKDYFAILRESYPTTAKNYDEVIAFIDHEVELLERKSGGAKKPTKTQTENEVLKGVILDFMVPGTLYTITDFIKKVPECEGLANQKVSALLRQMIADGKVVRIEEKRKAYFQLSED